MTPAARLQASFDLFSAVQSTARPADAVVSNWLRGRRGVGDFDRGAVLALLGQLLRHRARLGWWVTRLSAKETPRNLVLAWLTLGEGKVADQLPKLLHGAMLPPLTPQETAMLTKLRGATLHHPDMPERVLVECPDWAEAPLKRRFGEAFAVEMAATLVEPPLDLRVNPLKTTRAAALASLKALGLTASETPLAPQGIRVAERFALGRLSELQSGAVEIQDEGSQLVAELVAAKPGERVVDFCAGAGGKTLAIAAQMANKGKLMACDVSEGRLKRCAERMRQAGLHNCEPKLLSSESDRWVKRHKRSFDRVLVDAPCSGTGTWRRNPDARWRPEEEQGLEALLALQARILTSAARLVKPSGRLVYATCSLLPEENEAQVAAFLAAHPAFKLLPLSALHPELPSCQPDYLSLTPARHGTDGFFAAVLERLPEEAPQNAPE